MIYTSVGVISAIVFDKGFEFLRFKLPKTKRTVSLFRNVVLCPAVDLAVELAHARQSRSKLRSALAGQSVPSSTDDIAAARGGICLQNYK